MRKNVLIVIWTAIVVTCAGLAAGCAPGTVRTTAGVFRPITMEQSGQTITVTEGQFFQIRLNANPSTGYDWYVTQIDDVQLSLYRKRTQPANKTRVGAGVQTYYWFQALKSGSTNLEMKYYRSWEGPSSATETFRLQVTVVPSTY
jgi:inhibitor of cysteine peptidase